MKLKEMLPCHETLVKNKTPVLWKNKRKILGNANFNLLT